jgi:CelD/BcsL family acetyltransferase involved in cellulose biosynthesis
MMFVRLITSFDELTALEGEWNALAADAPFRSWDWLATWWKHYGTVDAKKRRAADRRLNVLAIYDRAGDDSRQLIGVAPWYLEHSLVSGNVLRWLGDGEVCTDHLSLVCRPEHGRYVAAAVAEALTGPFVDWDRLDLENVDADDENVEFLMASFREHQCAVSRQRNGACWAVTLPATWEDYLAENSKSHRKQLRQLERRVLTSGRAHWRRVDSANDFAEGWGVLVDLHQQRRKSLGEPGCFASRPFHEFHRELAARMLNRGQLRLSWLELDGAPAAAEYHFAGEHTTYAYQGGVDPSRLDEEPGRLSTILCLRAAVDEGQQQFDFLRGNEPYKAHWRATPRATCNFRVTPNRRLARFRGDMLQAAERVTDWVRHGVQRRASLSKPAGDTGSVAAPTMEQALAEPVAQN